MTVRSLDDRIAEAMWRERLGLMRPLWADWREDQKADWLTRAAHLRRIFTELGVQIKIVEQQNEQDENPASR
jgi:hypothetical protein